MLFSSRWGQEGGSLGKKGAGGWRREDVKWESQGGGSWEELRKHLQHFVIFHNRNGTKKSELLHKGMGTRALASIL